MLAKNLKRFDYRLFIAILITGLLPTIYTTVRFNFLGNLPGDWGYNIASQLQYVNLIFEVLQEMLILPLFFLVGKTILDIKETRNKIKTGVISLTAVILFFSAILFIFANSIVTAMAQNPDLISETVQYIRYEIIGITFSNLVKFLMVILILKEWKKDIYKLLVVQMVFTIFFDSLFISELGFSLGLGVKGIAFTNIIVNIMMLAYMGYIVFTRYEIKIKEIFNDLSFKWQTDWLKVGGFSGIESFVRNFAFMIMIIRMINVVNEQGTFWVANGFIWGWMLLPILTLGELIKKETSESDENISRKTMGYFIVTTIIVVVWLVTIPLWRPFLQHVMNIGDYAKVFDIILVQVIFYIVFAYNNVMDSTFYGVGKTDYMLYQSLIVNVIWYGGAFILFKLGVFTPSLLGIAMLFGLGMVFDFIPTIVLYIKLLKDRNLKII
jgi:Na+-driven multidrug efflux pump